MPMYEYVCSRCAKQFEELVSHGATPACPTCATQEVERVPFSRTARTANGKSEGAGEHMPMGCGRCGDPRGPGACSMS